MSIQDLAAVGEIISAIAVIITLAYLAAQIRQNTRQMRSEGHKGITESYNQILAELLQDDELFRVVVRGCQDWDSISAFEQSRFHLLFHQHLMHFRMAYQLFKKGAVDRDVYQSIEQLHLNVLANRGARVWWAMVGESLVEAPLAAMIDAKLDDISGADQATTEAWSFYRPENWE